MYIVDGIAYAGEKEPLLKVVGFVLSAFSRELQEQFTMPIDVLTTGAIDEKFLERIKQEEIPVYVSSPPTQDDSVIIETDLTDDVRQIIADGMAEYKEHPERTVPLDAL
jgi:hypothetical protein